MVKILDSADIVEGEYWGFMLCGLWRWALHIMAPKFFFMQHSLNLIDEI